MKLIKIVGLYVMAMVLFPWEWLKEQPGAVRYAYWNTFSIARRWSRDIWEGREVGDDGD